jgi:hypothetical protein
MSAASRSRRNRQSPGQAAREVETTGTTVGVNIALPAELHRRLKVRAAERGLTVKAAVIEALDAWAGQPG